MCVAFCIPRSGVSGGSAEKSAEIAMQNNCVFLPLTALPIAVNRFLRVTESIAKSVIPASPEKAAQGAQSLR